MVAMKTIVQNIFSIKMESSNGVTFGFNKVV